MKEKGKHLSQEDRKVIEDNICKGLRKFETAKELGKSQSTIGKESNWDGGFLLIFDKQKSSVPIWFFF